MKFCATLGLILLCLCWIPNQSSAAKPIMRQQKKQVLGGYGPADPKDEGVVSAANFALTVALEEPSFTETLGLSDGDDPNNYVVEVLNASQQVVAGMNYKLTVALFRHSALSENCVGGFEVIVYNRFGDMSVEQRVSGAKGLVKALTVEEVTTVIRGENDK